MTSEVAMKIFCTACKKLKFKKDGRAYCSSTNQPMTIEYLDEYRECQFWQWTDPEKNRRKIDEQKANNS